MVLIEDTRNQIGKHKLLNAALSELGHTVVRSKLYVGDYARIDDMSICVDTKKDWAELAGNICGKQHARFRSECERAKEAGIKLIVLVEDRGSLASWASPKKRNGEPICKVNPLILENAMETMSERYGVEFQCCPKEDTARRLLKIFTEV